MARPAGHRINSTAWEDFVTRSGRTVQQVADASGDDGVSASTIRGLLGGFYKASPEQAHRIAEAAGLHVGTLFPSLLPGFATIATPIDVERANKRKMRRSGRAA